MLCYCAVVVILPAGVITSICIIVIITCCCANIGAVDRRVPLSPCSSSADQELTGERIRRADELLAKLAGARLRTEQRPPLKLPRRAASSSAKPEAETPGTEGRRVRVVGELPVDLGMVPLEMESLLESNPLEYSSLICDLTAHTEIYGARTLHIKMSISGITLFTDCFAQRRCPVVSCKRAMCFCISGSVLGAPQIKICSTPPDPIHHPSRSRHYGSPRGSG